MLLILVGLVGAMVLVLIIMWLVHEGYRVTRYSNEQKALHMNHVFKRLRLLLLLLAASFVVVPAVVVFCSYSLDQVFRALVSIYRVAGFGVLVVVSGGLILYTIPVAGEHVTQLRRGETVIWEKREDLGEYDARTHKEDRKERKRRRKERRHHLIAKHGLAKYVLLKVAIWILVLSVPALASGVYVGWKILIDGSL